MTLPFIDLAAQQERIKPLLDERIAVVLAHGKYIKGPEVAELESRLGEFVGGAYAIGCSSGTTALQIALMALDIGPGDEVITTPFSFFATVETICILGATPVFIDIDPKTYNLNSALLKEAITEKTKAIVPVSLYGQCADFEAINAVATGIPVIEDAAQSLGATHHENFSCNLSTMACTSFFPSKPLGCYGDGGACFTQDDALNEKMRMILNHGQKQRYVHDLIGINGRLDTLQAAILLAKLDIFSKEIELRQQVAAMYAKHLAGFYDAPFVEKFNKSAYGQFTIRVPNRDAVREHLASRGVSTAVHYPVLMNKQPVFAGTSLFDLSFPEAEKAAAEVMSLPFFPFMREEQVEQVCEALKSVEA